MQLSHLCCCALLLLTACRQPAPPKSVPVNAPAISRYADVDTVTYVLRAEGARYILQNRRNGKTYDIPKSQLEPPAEQEDMGPQLDLNYGPRVTAFPAGKGMAGLHFSSYEIAEGGSLALAEGYDLFMLLDTAANRLLPGILHPGQTSGRHKFMGYFEANYTRFYVSRPPANEVCLIGTRAEKVYVDRDNETSTLTGGPYHDIGILKWYRFNGAAWVYAPKLDRLCPVGKGAGELPPVTPISPIDMALEFYRNKRF